MPRQASLLGVLSFGRLTCCPSVQFSEEPCLTRKCFLKGLPSSTDLLPPQRQESLCFMVSMIAASFVCFQWTFFSHMFSRVDLADFFCTATPVESAVMECEGLVSLVGSTCESRPLLCMLNGKGILSAVVSITCGRHLLIASCSSRSPFMTARVLADHSCFVFCYPYFASDR